MSARAERRARLPQDPRHRCTIARLRPSKRALAACRALGVRTVGEFLALPRADFLALPGCTEGTLRSLERRVAAYLARAGKPVVKASEPGLRRALADLGLDPATLARCQAAALTTAFDFLAAPRDKLAAEEALGQAAWTTVAARVHAALPPAAVELALLPPRWLRLPLARLGLPPAIAETLTRRGCRELLDVLLLPDPQRDPALGLSGCAAIRERLDALALHGLELPLARSDGQRAFPDLWADLLALLAPASQELLRLRLGCAGPPLHAREVAARRGQPEPEVRAALAQARRTLRQGAAASLEILREEGRRALAAGDGVLSEGCLAKGTILHGAAAAGLSPLLPLRLLAFCWPDELHLLGTVLTRTPSARARDAERALRRLTRDLPGPAAALAQQLAGQGHALEPGLLTHLLREHLHLGLRFVPGQGEVVERRPDAVAARAAAILRETGPLLLDDLLFHYRDRHRRCHKGKLLEHLRADPRLLEIGPERWSLRERHLAELHALLPRARRFAERIHSARRRCAVRELAQGESLGERELWLLRDLLRRDPSLRDLGRGELFPRAQPLSGVLQDLTKELRRAGSELPTARFLDNQEPGRRALIARLLRRSRLFVEPAENRVDLLTNYPLNRERLSRLRHVVEACLAERGGFSTLPDVLEHVQATDLGGDWLNAHLLGDVLRRHGGFELLAGQVLAQSSLELGGWIRRKAREVLRQAGLPLTAPEIVAEAPELAPFAECLEELLGSDPMVRTGEGLHYRMV